MTISKSNNPFKIIPVSILLSLLLIRTSFAQTTGSISGTIEPKEKVVSIYALVRATGPFNKDGKKNRYKADFDKTTGRFSIENIHSGTYDISVVTHDLIIEGVNLRVEGDGVSLSLFEKRAISKKIEEEKDFFDSKKVIMFQGNINTAKVLVEKHRDRKTSMGKNFAFRRFDIYTFKNFDEDWKPIKNADFVLREVIDKSKPDQNIKRIFSSQLGGIVVKSEGNTTIPIYHIPK
ncbi:MAG: hypothetical protein Q7J67_06230 [bacterium]|nr:hypothetical protein [bacterium]